MSQTILRTQVRTRETEWPESTEVDCGTTIDYEGVTWICTRERGHADWSTPVHAAHYEQPDPFPHSVIGVAWIDTTVGTGPCSLPPATSSPVRDSTEATR